MLNIQCAFKTYIQITNLNSCLTQRWWAYSSLKQRGECWDGSSWLQIKNSFKKLSGGVYMKSLQSNNANIKNNFSFGYTDIDADDVQPWHKSFLMLCIATAAPAKA